MKFEHTPTYSLPAHLVYFLLEAFPGVRLQVEHEAGGGGGEEGGQGQRLPQHHLCKVGGEGVSGVWWVRLSKVRGYGEASVDGGEK